MILALETSTRNASLALCERGTGTLVTGSTFTSDRAHNAVIFTPLENILSAHRDRIEGIVVGLGPGSYGGVRVGLAVAQGLSVALGCPVLGGSSLEAWECGADSHVIVGDARRGSLFVAVVRERRLQGEPILVTEDQLEQTLSPLRGEGLTVHSADEKVVAARPGILLSFPRAHRLAWRHREASFSSTEGTALEPHYLRAPYITTPKART